MGRRQLVITVNGPGEIAAWLYPVTHALKARDPDLWIGVCLLPCVFSSGAEKDVLSGFDTVDAVTSVSESYAIILKNKRLAGYDPTLPTRMLHLGGEVVLSLLIARRLGVVIDAYAEGKPQWRRFFDRVFYSGLNKVPADPKSEVVGELMVDAADLRRGTREKGEGVSIALFPGSRVAMARDLLPLLARLADDMSAEDPQITWIMAQAPFIPDDFLRNFPAPRADAHWRVSSLRYLEEDGARYMVTEAGTRLRVLPGDIAMARADYAVSLPGTNTGEMAASGLPMVVVLPTYTAEDAPLPGLAGHIGGIPLIGKPIKRFLALNALGRLPILALPNRRAGRKLVPELAGLITQDDIAEALKGLMAQDRGVLAAELRTAMGGAGAAGMVAERVLKGFGPAPSALFGPGR